MGSSNFQTWNPGQANQETDAGYTSDDQRVNGAVTGEFPSPTANKLFHQVSIMSAALGEMLAAKGYVVSDADQNALAAELANLITFADLFKVVTVAFSATPVFDASQGSNFEIVLSGAVTSSTLINVTPGQPLRFIVKQDGTGGHAFVPPTNLPMASIDTTANVTNIQTFIVDNGSNVYPTSPVMIK